MLNGKQLDIPVALEPFRFSLQKSVLKSGILTMQHDQTTVLTSKLGGAAYQPSSTDYPKDYLGKPMLLLAQINFSEANIGEPFPANGLLQFFIAQNFYSLTDKEKAFYPHGTFSVRYFTNLDEQHQNSVDLDSADYKDFPIERESKVTFETVFEPVSATDYRISDYLSQEAIEQITFEDGRTFEDIYLQTYLGANNKIGGYPYFIHKDIRMNSVSLQKYDTLLLQIISDDEQGIMWGDTGIIQFFINKQQLIEKDFSNVFLHTEDYS